MAKVARGVDGPVEKAGPTPIPISGRMRTLLLVGVLLALAFVAWWAPAVPLVALGGFALALVLSFPVRLLSRFVPRPLAIAVAFLGLVGLAALALWVLPPMLADQFRALVGAAPGLASDAERTLRGLLEPLAERGLLPSTTGDLLAGLWSDLLGRVRDSAEGFLDGLLGFVPMAFELAICLLATLVVAGYMLADGRKMEAAYLRAAPKGYRRDAKELWDAFGLSLSRYLSGLAFVMLVQGALSALALWAIGVPYAFVLGAWVAVTAAVPLIGAWVGAVPGVLVALSVSPTAALATALVFLAIQQLEGNVLTPRIQGRALRLHPILILLGVIGAGQLAGPLGVLLAVPALAVARVLFDFLRPRLRARSRPVGEPPGALGTSSLGTSPHGAAETRGHGTGGAADRLTNPGLCREVGESGPKRTGEIGMTGERPG